MRMRITTGMAMNTYRYNLQNSTANMTDSRNKVLTHRKFDSFAEDPASAIQAWRVRRSMVNTACYAKNNKDTLTRFDIAYATMGAVTHELTDLDGRSADIYAANDPTAAGRNELGKVLSETAESVIHAMNGAKSGSDFVFAGDDELNAPFTWNADRTILYYRGVNVNAGSVKSPAAAPEWAPKDAADPKKGADVTDNAALAQAFKDSIPASENEAEREWVDYYKGVTNTQPSSAAPDWVPKNAAGNPVANDDASLAQAYKDSLPDQGTPEYSQMSNAERAWVDYYKGNSAQKPDAEPAWNVDPKDDFGVPKGARDILNDPNASAYDKAWAEYYLDQGDVKHLQKMSEEEAPIDLGMGLLRDDNGNLVPGTYYNRTLPGINMLGFGVDEDGDPKNVCMIMKQLGEIYSRCTKDEGRYASDQDYEDAMRLMNKLKDAQGYASGKYVDISAEASFLKQNQERLDLQVNYLNEQRSSIENVDLADAIINFSWDYYCYSAALKVGTQLLSQSLIDYMS